MSLDYKRTLPQYILTIIVAIFLLEYALPEGPLTVIKNELSVWLTLIASFTFFVAGLTLILRYGRNLTQGKEIGSGQLYAAEFFLIFFAYIGAALLFGGIAGDTYKNLFTNLHGNLTQGAWVLYVFLEPWAAYRAFQLRSKEAIILAITGLTYILYLAPSIPAVIPSLGAFAEWIVTTPSRAGARGAIITMGVGALLLAFRMLTGKERGIVD
jgi:hypothetical protein